MRAIHPRPAFRQAFLRPPLGGAPGRAPDTSPCAAGPVRRAWAGVAEPAGPSWYFFKPALAFSRGRWRLLDFPHAQWPLVTRKIVLPQYRGNHSGSCDLPKPPVSIQRFIFPCFICCCLYLHFSLLAEIFPRRTFKAARLSIPQRRYTSCPRKRTLWKIYIRSLHCELFCQLPAERS